MGSFKKILSLSDITVFMNIYAFIDSQNLNLSILEQGWQLNFARFRVYLKDKYKVGKIFLFIVIKQINNLNTWWKNTYNDILLQKIK